MEQVQIPARMTPEEFLILERAAMERHQYLQGKVSAIQGDSVDHSAITSNVIGVWVSKLKRTNCRVYEANLRIGVPVMRFFTYPDVSVVCGDVKFDPRDDH